MAEDSVIESVDSLLDSLDDVEEALEPLLSKSLQDSLDNAEGPIERAKILFWVAYAIHSCTWAFTKTAAVDAEDHGVMDELNRIKQYNGKILAAVKRAESKTDGATASTVASSESERKRMPLDKEAASRFIKAGIANQPSKPSDSSTFYSAEATVNDPLAGPGPHSRLSSLARISTPKEEDGSSGLASSSSSSSSDGEADLQVYTSMVAPASSQAQKVQASPKEGPTPEITSQGVVSQADSDKKKRKQEKKRKRLLGTDVETAGFRKTLLDPLQGYDREGGAAGQPKKAKTQTGGNQDGSSRASSVSNLQSDSTAASGKDAGEHKKKKRKRKQQALH